MNNRRLIYRVFLKSFAVIALLILLVVLFNSLFTNKNNNDVKKAGKTPLIALNIAGMKKGEVRKIRVGSKEVAVLYREQAMNNLNENSLNPNGLRTSNSRSINPDYFVYYNHGDSGNCPLFYAKSSFKDVCSGAFFDTSGRNMSNKEFGYQLKLPPHFFDDKTIMIGTWKASTTDY